MGRFLLLIRLAWQYLEHITRRYPKKKALFSKFVYIYNSYCPCSSPLLPRRDRSHYAALLSLWSWWLLAYSDPGLCFVQETWCRFNRSFMLILGFTWLFFFFILLLDELQYSYSDICKRYDCNAQVLHTWIGITPEIQKTHTSVSWACKN